MNLLLVILVLVLALQFAVLIGPPYVPTLRRQRRSALELLELKPGQTLVDLGCGDGSLLIDAARQGIKGVGYEINPLLASIAWLRAKRYKSQVKIHLKNFWKADISKADGVYVFLAGKYMAKFDKFLKSQVSKPIKVISYGFEIPNTSPIKKKDGLNLYKYH